LYARWIPYQNQTFVVGVPDWLRYNTGLMVKSGYSFAGWNTSQFGFGTSYSAGEYVTFSSNQLLYAEWAPLQTNLVGSKEYIVPVVTERLFGTDTGTLYSASAAFSFTGIPSNAKITNIQVWNPLSSNVSQGPGTTIDGVRIQWIEDLYNSNSDTEFSDLFPLYIISAPTSQNPCNTVSLNGFDASKTFRFWIFGEVKQNITGVEGFTVLNTRVRVTYSYSL